MTDDSLMTAPPLAAAPLLRSRLHTAVVNLEALRPVLSGQIDAITLLDSTMALLQETLIQLRLGD